MTATDEAYDIKHNLPRQRAHSAQCSISATDADKLTALGWGVLLGKFDGQGAP
jgi:hypothetical protein